VKFGVALPNFGKYARKNAILKIARAAEELGFESLWVSDHIVIPESHRGFGDMFYEPLTTLTYIGACTSRIRLGTSVIILPYRNPVVLAKTISTLDVLSGGRVILGVGVGWLKDEFNALGIPYEERGPITDECIEILKALWTREKPSFKGSYYKFSEIKFLPRPIQKPYPPILVGGNSRRAIERAVDAGDGWHSVGLTPEEIREKVEFVNQLLSEKGKETSDFVISLRKNLQIKGISEKKAEDKEILRGTPDKISEGIERYKESGVSHIVFQVLSGTLEGVVETMELFSRDIRPALNL
jgi:probable F420-dependent oxidoreductase